mgnify:CR=1 FL=1
MKKTLSEETKKLPPIEEESDPTPHLDSTPEGEQDNMSYAYPKYNNESETEARVRAFLTMWQENHISQQLAKPKPEAEAEKSKIVEFRLSLDCQAARW